MAEKRGFLARYGKRILVIIAGSGVVIAGVAMLVLPGPGLLVIFAGLAILSTEFEWADRLRQRVRERAEEAAKRTGVSLGAIVAVGIFFAVVLSVAAWIYLD
ncbi:MAG: PGPGW domain-containing protein [Actinomycetota bacterium]